MDIFEHYLRGLKLEPGLAPDRLAAELAVTSTWTPYFHDAYPPEAPLADQRETIAASSWTCSLPCPASSQKPPSAPIPGAAAEQRLHRRIAAKLPIRQERSESGGASGGSGSSSGEDVALRDYSARVTHQDLGRRIGSFGNAVAPRTVDLNAGVGR
jgi:hypothetical protein